MWIFPFQVHLMLNILSLSRALLALLQDSCIVVGDQSLSPEAGPLAARAGVHSQSLPAAVAVQHRPGLSTLPHHFR